MNLPAPIRSPNIPAAAGSAHTGHPRPAPLPDCFWNKASGKPRPWCVIGTAYGYLHRTNGMVRTWATRSGAAKAARRYVPL